MFSFSYCSQTYAYGDKYSPDEIFELYADKSTKLNISSTKLKKIW